MLIRADHDHIYLEGKTWEHREILRGISGARWNKQLRCWMFPANYSVFSILRGIFKNMKVDQSCEIITEKAAKDIAAERVKDWDNVPEVPVAKKPAWRHQAIAFWFAVKRFEGGEGAALLNLDMGCGKSAVTTWLVKFMEARRVLIVCPKSVVPVWMVEFMKHVETDLFITPLGNGMSVKQKAGHVDGDGVYIINKDAVWREPLRNKLLGMDWDFVIHDECHQGKSAGSKISKFMHKIGRKAKYRLGLTGTVAPHSPLDLYGQFRFLDPSIFGTSWYSFRDRYSIMGGFEGKQVVGYKNEEELRARFESIAYSVKSDDVLDLPDVVEVEKYCVLSPAEKRIYSEMKKEMITEIEAGTVTAANAMVKILRLSQIANGTVRTEDGKDVEVGNSKKKLLEEVVEGIKAKEKIVVFCRFRSDLDAVRDVVSDGRGYFELSGRVNELEEWKKSSPGSVIGVQVQAGGVGIDLTDARYCIYFSPTFSLGDYEQSRKRVHRPGQERTVFYIKLICRATVDVDIYRALRTKRDIVEVILGRLGRGDCETEDGSGHDRPDARGCDRSDDGPKGNACPAARISGDVLGEAG